LRDLIASLGVFPVATSRLSVSSRSESDEPGA
jgi:hypothetical protein